MKTRSKFIRLAAWLLTIALLAVSLSIGSFAAVSAETTDYIGSKISNPDQILFYSLTQTETGYQSVAYCYDKSLKSPDGQKYTKVSDITNSQYKALLYNGYPYDGGGLMEKLELSEDAFRSITQWAIWAYRNETADDSTYEYYHSNFSADDINCFDLLIGRIESFDYNGETITLADVPENFSVSLYYYSGDARRQRLIAATLEDNPELYPYAVSFKKTDASGLGLAGASLQLQKADGTVLEQWTSTSATRTFQLTAGSYQIVETQAPDGYAVASPVSFTVAPGGTVTVGGQVLDADTPITMVDEIPSSVYLSKQDASGKDLEGATIQLQKADGTVVDTWISNGETHRFDVTPGEYQFVETAAPSGYQLASSISFTVEADGTVTSNQVAVTADAPIVMVDNLTPINYYPVYLDKQDGTGNALSGATIQLQTAYGAPLQTWISDGSRHTYYLPSGSYQLVETAAPEGYQLAEKIVFTVDGAGRITIGGTTSNAPIVMIDQPEVPEVPEEPESQDETPESPDEPETPENPEVPDESEVSAEPETPDEPEAIEEPEVPAEPEASAEPEESESAEFEEFGDSPKTGDLTAIWIALAVMIGSLIGIVLVLRKKKNI